MTVNMYEKYVATNMLEGLTISQAQQVAKIQTELFLNPRDLPAIPLDIHFHSKGVVLNTPCRTLFYSPARSSPLVINAKK
jgi:hypothetical protein